GAQNVVEICTSVTASSASAPRTSAGSVSPAAVDMRTLPFLARRIRPTTTAATTVTTATISPVTTPPFRAPPSSRGHHRSPRGLCLGERDVLRRALHGDRVRPHGHAGRRHRERQVACV